MTTPSGRRVALEHLTRRGMSQRKACRYLGLSRRVAGTRAEAKVLIERWRQFYNEQRPHSAHRYQPPARIRQRWLETANIEPRLTA